jgi:oligopeptide/dipeptide ABC transporter ATP-binding protein
MGEVILDVKNLHTRFRARSGHVYAVNGVSFHVDRGETLGVVGESGSGKSVSMLSMLGLLPPAAQVQAGEAFFHGEDLLKMNRRQMQKVRGGQIGMIFQDPMTSFNPVLSMGDQIGEPLIYHRGAKKQEAQERAVEMLRLVGIPDPLERIKSYPHQFSGGMRQRAMIAMSLICEPDLVIADEPTTALDVTIQAQIVELVKDLRDRLGVAIIWITHDLSLVAGFADRIMVMYGGTIVEEGKTEDIFDDPRHPYTLGLLSALPAYQAEKKVRRLSSIPGSPPDIRKPPAACPFAPRCRYAIERCRQELPQLAEAAGGGDPGHRLACWIDTRSLKADQGAQQ